MFRLAASVALSLLFVAATAQAGQYGTAKEAKAMLQRAVAAVKDARQSQPAKFRFPDHEMEKAEPRLSAFR
jgi:predicted Rossmann fold nucleotide-binding protein DprA/Smf involved in DNA uptake